MFQPAQYTMKVNELIKGGFIGSIKQGKEFVFSDSKIIGINVLMDSVDFENQKEGFTLVAETFKIQLNFKFNTKLCFDLLGYMVNTNNDFFEHT